jgi:hypothetical protein
MGTAVISSGASLNLWLGCNLYSDGTNWRYMNAASNTGRLFGAAGNAIIFYSVAAGLAGAIATLVQTMNLTDTGNLTVTGNSTLTGGIIGVANNALAATGIVGEDREATVLGASAISLTTATNTTLTTLNLPAGDWDVRGNVLFNASVGFTLAQAAVNNSSTFPDNALRSWLTPAAATTVWGTPVVRQRFGFNTTTTVYLIVNATFASGTCTACGNLGARRVR